MLAILPRALSKYFSACFHSKHPFRESAGWLYQDGSQVGLQSFTKYLRLIYEIK